MYDERLVRAAQAGDEAAFAALYDRAIDSVYDLCWSLTGDAEEAARLVEQAFVLAARNLEQLTEPSQLRPWLLAIAGDQAVADEAENVLKSGWGTADEGGVEPLGTSALRKWAADAAAVLALPDQLVLELQLRQQLEDDQLAATIGCSPSQLPALLERVDQEAETVLGALVLARQGRQHCSRLAALLADWNATPSVEIADAVDAHAQTCNRCARQRRLLNPLELVADAPRVVAPAALRTPILDLVAGEVAQHPGAGVEAVADERTVAVPRTQRSVPVVGFADSRSGSRRVAPIAIVTAVSVAVVVLAGAVVIALHTSSPSRVSSNPPPSAAASTTVTDSNGAAGTLVPIDSTTSTTVVAGSVLSLDTTRVDLGGHATSAQVILRETAPTGASWTATSGVAWLTPSPASGFLASAQSVHVTFTIDRTQIPPGPFDGQVLFAASDPGSRSTAVDIVGTSGAPTTSTIATTTVAPPSITISNVSATPSTIYTSPCALRAVTSTVTATVTSSTTPNVTLAYSLPGQGAGTEPMTTTFGGQYQATLPSSPTAGTITYQVVATANATSREATGTVTVVACNPAQ